MEVKTLSFEQVTTQLKEMRDEVAKVFDAHRDENGNVKFEEIPAEDTTKIRDWNAQLSDLQKRWEDLNELRGSEDKLASLKEFLEKPAEEMRHPNGQKRPTWKDAGALFLESAAHKSYVERGVKDIWTEFDYGSLYPELKVAIDSRGYKGPDPRFTSKGVLGTDSALADVAQQYVPEVLRDPRLFTNILSQPPNIADLCVQVTTGQNSISYMEQTTRTLAAAETAEGALSPESSLEWTERTDPIAKITHSLPVTDELLSDEGFLRGIINAEMRSGVAEREDLQLLLGDGVGQNIEGLINRTGVNNVNRSLTGVDGQNYAESIFAGITNARQTFRVPSAIVLNAFTWEFIRLAKDSQNQYLFLAGIQSAETPRLWGLPVAVNENMANYDTATNIGAFIGPFATDAYVVRRTGIELAVSDSHGDRFLRDVLTIKARERVGLAVLRPAAFTTITSIA